VIESTKKDFFLRDDLREYLEDNFKIPVDVGYLSSFREYYRTKIEKDIIYV
jgi:predicted nucleotidyltransferase